MFPLVSALCWRHDKPPDPLLHIWWDCHLFVPFWTRVFNVYVEVASQEPSCTPQLALLSVIPGSFAKIKDILRYFLTAARSLIPRHWWTSWTLTVSEWIHEKEHLLLTTHLHDRYYAFLVVWSPWLLFKD